MTGAPYYEHGGITIYHGDCREVLPGIAFDVLVTDPPYCEIAARRLSQEVLDFGGVA